MSSSTRYYEDLSTWLGELADDDAFKDFLPKLKDHILSRVLGVHDRAEFSDDDRNTIHIVGNRIFRHKVIRFNYTTYDMRRNQDSCNPRTRSDVMVLAGGEEADTHPYWFARIVGIFHVKIVHVGPKSRTSDIQNFDLLFVRWFDYDTSQSKYGIQSGRMPRIHFLDSSDLNAFGFVNPDDVIRAAHIIPGFHYGRTDDILGPSVVRRISDGDEDWSKYYVNMWADRDMFLRFRGGAIGHKATRKATKVFELQNDVLSAEGKDLDDGEVSEGQVDEAGSEAEGESEYENSDAGDEGDNGEINVMDEDELGAEDGEEPVDDEDYLGFAAY